MDTLYFIISFTALIAIFRSSFVTGSSNSSKSFSETSFPVSFLYQASANKYLPTPKDAWNVSLCIFSIPKESARSIAVELKIVRRVIVEHIQVMRSERTAADVKIDGF